MLVLVLIILLIVILVIRRRRKPDNQVGDAPTTIQRPFGSKQSFLSDPKLMASSDVDRENVSNPAYEGEDEFTRAASYLMGDAPVSQGIHNPTHDSQTEDEEIENKNVCHINDI